MAGLFRRPPQPQQRPRLVPSGTGFSPEVLAELASATGAAGDSGPSIAVNAELASGGTGGGWSLPLLLSGGGTTTATGTAYDATVTTANETNAPAELASGTGAAGDIDAIIAPNAGHSSATGAANQPSPAVAPIGNNASASGQAFGVAGDILSGPGSASASGAAGGPAPALAVNVGNAAASGSAFDATVTVPGATTVDAEHASGTGQAFDATVDTGVQRNQGPVIGDLGQRRVIGGVLFVYPEVAEARGRAYSAYAYGDDDDTVISLLMQVA